MRCQIWLKSAGRSVNRGSVLPGGVGGGLRDGGGEKAGGGWSGIREGFLGDTHLSRRGEC